MADNQQTATTVAASSAALTVPTVKKLAQHQQAYLSLSLSSGILRFDGPFTLKSGRSSPYFFNAGKFFESGDGLAQLASCYAQTIVDSGIKFDTLFGPAYKGIPLAAVTALVLSRDHGMSVGFSFNRKEAKAHGEGGNLVGAPLAGRILVLDDVITAGTAIKEAFGFITASAEKWDSEHPDAGGEGGEEASGENVVPAAQNTASLGKSTNGRPELVGVVVALDRQERTSDAKDAPSAIQHVRAEYGVEVLPVVTLEDIIEYMRSNTSSFEKEIEGMQSYREQYGVPKAKE